MTELPGRDGGEEAFAGARVVVVDDNEPSAQLVQALLARAGLPGVVAIHHPRELLDRLPELAPHLLILDLHMPGLDGYAVLERLRAEHGPADLPVLVLTADTTRGATRRALELGANDFLTKPLDAVELVLRVRNLLQARTMHTGLLRRQRWLEAAAKLPAELLAGECEAPLRRVCELARDAAQARFAALIAAGGGIQRVRPRIGTWVGERTDADALALADAFAAGLPAAAATARPGLPGTGIGPFVSVPLLGRDRVLGALVLAREPGAEEFGAAELALAQGFASQAAIAVELAEARAEQARMLVLSDRHRIARDLHDQVIQRLFATGLRLQHVVDRLGPGPLADQPGEHVGSLDDTITEIRSTIFGLRSPEAEVLGVRARLSELVEELAEILDVEPELRLEGDLDAIGDELADDLLLAAREALTNVARHARARAVEVTVERVDDDVRLEVRDDGVGIGAAERRSGLINLYERARRHGGTCRVSAAPDGGTTVEWTTRLTESDATGAAQSSSATIVSGR